MLVQSNVMYSILVSTVKTATDCSTSSMLQPLRSSRMDIVGRKAVFSMQKSIFFAVCFCSIRLN